MSERGFEDQPGEPAVEMPNSPPTGSRFDTSTENYVGESPHVQQPEWLIAEAERMAHEREDTANLNSNHYRPSRVEIARIVGGFSIAAGGVAVALSEVVTGWQSKTILAGSMIAIAQSLPIAERAAGFTPSFPSIPILRRSQYRNRSQI